MKPIQLDRWLLCTALDRTRIFPVDLSHCCDEFGNGFGTDGNHFFVRALAAGEDYDTVRAYLEEYYETHHIRSMNDTLGHDISDPAGAQYFCPWEADRIRPLSKFAGSHKIGPTPDDDLDRIDRRLLGVVASIRRRGFRQYAMLDGFPRIYTIVNRDNHRRHVIRDGQHRIAAISHLGHESVLACYEAHYWTPSWAYRALSRVTSPSRGAGARPDSTTPRIVRADEIESWPHVREGRISAEEASVHFDKMFGDTAADTHTTSTTS
jgi:hypothetical protein